MKPDDERGGKREIMEALDGIAELYGQRLSDHGLSSQSVCWKTEASQILRFDQLVYVLNQEHGGEEMSVNDFGCGYAAMFRYLDELPNVRLGQYYGYDISDEMLKAAGETVTDARAHFIKSSRVTEEADYSFVSGTFNVKLGASDEVWVEHLKEMLMNLAEKSRKGFAFNLLSTYVDWKQEDLYYGDPFMFFDFCKRHISRYVALLHDYPLYEWTIVVSKDK